MPHIVQTKDQIKGEMALDRAGGGGGLHIIISVIIIVDPCCCIILAHTIHWRSLEVCNWHLSVTSIWWAGY